MEERRKPTREEFSEYCHGLDLVNEGVIERIWQERESSGWVTQKGKPTVAWKTTVYNVICQERCKTIEWQQMEKAREAARRAREEQRRLANEARRKAKEEIAKTLRSRGTYTTHQVKDAEHAYHVYTDGSAWFHPFKRGVWCGGSAYIILHNGEVFRQGNYGNTETTNNRMEMLAIICGVAHCPDGARIVVHSDSQYSLKVLSGKWKAKVNTDLVAMHIKHSAKKGRITYHWVKGHAGNKYNELCDQLANEGRIRAMRDAGLDWKKALETTGRWRASKGESKIVV